ncbi:MAG: MCE family protein [Bacteroidetes bacterium]|nr:MAG: MCE family protein [Bacteroidota bacterium]
MKYANEFKVGLSILLAAIIFILGVRFFEDLPLFRGTTTLETAFENASGLIAGNTVRVNGVTVGSVDDVQLDPATNQVRVRFHVKNDIKVPEGSRTRISGFDALNVVRMDLLLGPPENPPIPDGGFVPSETETDLLGTLTDRAPALVDRVDSVLVGLTATLDGTQSLLNDPGSDLRQTLSALRTSLGTLNTFLRTEQGRVRQVLENTETLTAGLNEVVSEQGDSLGVVVQHLNQVLARLDRNLATFETTTATLDEMLARLNRGEGTLGRLLVDDALYVKLDTTLTNLNNLLAEFQAHPRKYLRELKLIDIF